MCGITMSDLRDALNRVIVPINKEGYFIIAVSAVITFLLFIIDGFLGEIGLVLTLFVVYFFRDPSTI